VCASDACICEPLSVIPQAPSPMGGVVSFRRRRGRQEVLLEEIIDPELLEEDEEATETTESFLGRYDCPMLLPMNLSFTW
jgi:hypothetical protein